MRGDAPERGSSRAGEAVPGPQGTAGRSRGEHRFSGAADRPLTAPAPVLRPRCVGGTRIKKPNHNLADTRMGGVEQGYEMVCFSPPDRPAPRRRSARRTPSSGAPTITAIRVGLQADEVCGLGVPIARRVDLPHVGPLPLPSGPYDSLSSIPWRHEILGVLYCLQTPLRRPPFRFHFLPLAFRCRSAPTVCGVVISHCLFPSLLVGYESRFLMSGARSCRCLVFLLSRAFGSAVSFCSPRPE